VLGQPHGTSTIVSRMQSGVTQKDGVGAGQEAFEVVLVIVGQDILGIFEARKGVTRRIKKRQKLDQTERRAMVKGSAINWISIAM